MAESICRLVWAQHTYHRAQHNRQLCPVVLVAWHPVAMATVQDLEHQRRDRIILHQAGAQPQYQQLPQDLAASQPQ